MRKASVLVIFLTVFIDLIGFGIVVPLVPGYSAHFGAHGYMIGVIIASFSAMQFLFAPVWGKLSDRHGRRPILLISTAGAAISYVLFALATKIEDHSMAIWLMIVSRSFAGLCGGNIVVAQAYIADITPPEKRSKKMGLIGMAFGLGFICGPILGGLSLRHLGQSGPGWVAAALCAFNFILALSILGESKAPDSSPVADRPHLHQWRHTLSQPGVGTLVVVFFWATFCFSCFESTLPLLVSDNFNLDIRTPETSLTTIVYLFAYCGILGAFVQGGMIGRLVKAMGEARLISLSLILTAVAMFMLPFIRGGNQLSWSILIQPQGIPWIIMLIALGLLSLGSSLTRAPLFGLLSNLTPPNEQGANIGVAQGAASLARIMGPIFATTLLVIKPALPYVLCALILLATTGLAILRLHKPLTPPPAT
jgi:multidrug resistance protein